jgi:hypothetical protein
MIVSIFENSTETASLAMQYWLSRAFRRWAVAILDAAMHYATKQMKVLMKVKSEL